MTRPVAATASDAAALRGLIQRFIRAFGLLSADHTPCGKPLPLSHAHALMLLVEHGRADRKITQQDLGKTLGIDKSNVARLCAKMERAGHVKQERSPLDGRARLLSLTKAGVKVAENVEHSSQERFRQIIEAVSPDARRSVLATLDQLNGAVSTVLEPSPGEARRRAGGAP